MTVVEYSELTAPLTEEQRKREERARTLEAAALEIEVRGWCQHARELENGHVCLVGAVTAGLAGDPWSSRGGYAFTRSFFPGLGFDIEEWNDSNGRTAEEVTFLLRWRAEEIRDGWDA